MNDATESVPMDVHSTGTHFHVGEVVVYSLAEGCPYVYSGAFHCPACGGTHVCGKGC